MGLGLIAATAAIIGFVRYRAHESARLRVDLGLSADLRGAAGADPVRLAAVDEFETGVYRRLFYVSVVGPRVRGAAWSLLGLILAVAGALAVSPLRGGLATTAYVLTGAFAIVFGVAAAVNTGLAIYHTVATPRVSFDEVETQEVEAQGVEAQDVEVRDVDVRSDDSATASVVDDFESIDTARDAAPGDAVGKD